jgi:DNA/RNA endonuclease YhcR with UshA esterase domain
MKIGSISLRTALALAVCLVLVACNLMFAKISDIKAHPDKYENKSVTVHGKVTSVTKLPFMEEGFYTLSDGTGEITVVTRGSLPSEGADKTVTGTVESTVTIMGRSFGVTIEEKS